VPNNNPEGHNQYSKSESRSASSGGGASSTGSSGSGVSSSTGSGKSKRGFASMQPEMQREIASKGGQSQGKQNNPGNFANDREKARAAGRKGGEAHGANR